MQTAPKTPASFDPQTSTSSAASSPKSESLRPGQTTEAVTKQAAELIGQIADGMRVRGIAAHDAAHFLMKLMFSMFADDIGLLRNKVFTSILKAAKDKPAVLAQRMQALFERMSTGGYFGPDDVLHFNGGLFADAAVIELRKAKSRKPRKEQGLSVDSLPRDSHS